MAGVLAGVLSRSGLTVESVLDEDGDYTDKYKIEAHGMEFIIQLLPPTFPKTEDL